MVRRVESEELKRVGLERLGASDGFATFLLELLRRNGWEVSLSPALGQPGKLVTARKMGHDVRRVATSAPEAALAVFEECDRRMRLGGQAQLPLPIA